MCSSLQYEILFLGVLGPVGMKGHFHWMVRHPSFHDTTPLLCIFFHLQCKTLCSLCCIQFQGWTVFPSLSHTHTFFTSRADKLPSYHKFFDFLIDNHLVFTCNCRVSCCIWTYNLILYFIVVMSLISIMWFPLSCFLLTTFLSRHCRLAWPPVVPYELFILSIFWMGKLGNCAA